MTLLIIGVVLFCVLHLFPALLPAIRTSVQGKLGENTYRGLFALLIVGSLVVIVFGWKSASPTHVYVPPLQSNPLTSLLILAGLILFFAAQTNGNIKRVIRHPQMTGTMLWGIAHLLLNGDSRSVALFGSLTVWALLEILLINRRDGARAKPGPAALRNDLIPIVAGVLVFGAIMHFHATLFGVSAYPT